MVKYPFLIEAEISMRGYSLERIRTCRFNCSLGSRCCFRWSCFRCSRGSFCSCCSYFRCCGTFFSFPNSSSDSYANSNSTSREDTEKPKFRFLQKKLLKSLPYSYPPNRPWLWFYLCVIFYRHLWKYKKIELNYFSNTYVLRNNVEFRSLAEFKDKQAFDIYLETTKNSKFCHKLYQCQRIYTGGNTLELRYLNISDC